MGPFNKALDDSEIIKLVMQFMEERGFHEVSEQLSSKSGITKETHAACQLRYAILNGDFGACIAALDSLQIAEAERSHVIVAVYGLQFIELVRDGKPVEAMYILRRHLQYKNILVPLTRLLLCDSSKVEGEIDRLPIDLIPKSRKGLIELIQGATEQPTILPNRRLQALLHQALLFQNSHCSCPQACQELSLLRDHKCRKSKLQIREVSKKHFGSEVWTIGISAGQLVALLEGKRIVIVDHDTLEELHSWELNSVCLLMCCHEELVLAGFADGSVSVFDIKSRSIKFHSDQLHSHQVATGAFVSRDIIVTASSDYTIVLYDWVNQKPLFRWSDISCSFLCLLDDSTLLAVHNHSTLLGLSLCSKRILWQYSLPASVTFALPLPDNSILLSCLDDAVRIFTSGRISSTHREIVHKRFNLNVAATPNFIISPSEDGRLVAWQSNRVILDQQIGDQSINQVLVEGNLIYVGGDDGNVRKLTLGTNPK
jgi:hypothetical protein